MHRPLYSTGSHESGDPRRFWAVGYNNGVELLAGHDHLYERFAPVDHRGNLAPAGIRSFVGTGGEEAVLRWHGRDRTTREVARNYGALLLLTLRPDSHDWSSEQSAVP